MRRNKNLKKIYDGIYQKGEKKHFTKLATKGTTDEKEVLKLFNWRKKNVIDIGCGTGKFAFLVSKQGANVLGIDYSKKAIEIAKDTYKNPNLKFEQEEMTKNVNGKFDIIISLGTLEHTDDPFSVLKMFKKHLSKNGYIVITCPNWTNPRGYILMALYYLFGSPITLADIHYLSPKNFEKWSKKLDMRLEWKTFDRSWGHGKRMIEDLKKRLPKVLSDSKLPNKNNNIKNLISWLEEEIVTLDNTLPHSGAIGLYKIGPKKF